MLYRDTARGCTRMLQMNASWMTEKELERERDMQTKKKPSLLEEKYDKILSWQRENEKC